MDVFKVKLWASIVDVILISSDSSDVESHGKKTCNANLMADLQLALLLTEKFYFREFVR